VDEGVLVGVAGAASSIVVGSPAWYAWLEQATTFTFRSAEGSFSARKERSGRTGSYWKAYRKQADTLHRAYLGKSSDLTLDRLHAIASDLAGRATGPPLEAPGVVSPPSVAADGERSHPTEARLPTGTLTFCFTDIEGSTQLWEQHRETMPQALARHEAIIRAAIQAHRGVVFKTVGDGFHAVFARAADALEATLRAQRSLHAELWGETGPVRVRMALHSGAAELRDSDYFGPPLNRVARILALGHGGQVLLSQATHDLIADDLPSQITLRALGEYLLKDLTRPELIFQLVSPELPSDFPPLRAAHTGPTPAPAQAPPILTTKLYAPPPRPQLVERPRLLARLQAGLTGKLTLLCAPAGFGKTMLVSAWLQSVERRAQSIKQLHDAPALRSAWVSLDATDSDPLRFWSYVIAALDKLQLHSGASALMLLQSPQPPPIEAVLTPLLNALSTLATDAVLVLDDYHLIDAPTIHSALAFLLDHLPPQLHLVMTTRADPPLPLTRLRARGQLTELRAADLRFTADETAAFLTELMGLPLSAEDVAALEARTEGWIAGLHLAALAMRDRADLPKFVAAFTGSNHFVVDYLAEEVFRLQPAHLQQFLLQTAILDRICGPLCDAVLGLEARDVRLGDIEPASSLKPQAPRLSAYSQLILEQLERANLFMVPLDDERKWYRYHHLFADVLRERLHSSVDAARVALLHRRASAWYEQHELLPEAIQHALAAQDWERAVRQIEQCAWPIAFRGQIHTVIGWFNALPAAFIPARPSLCVLHALMLMHTDQLEAAEARLQEAEHGLLNTPEELARPIQGLILTTGANISFYRGDLPRCVVLGRQALDILPETTSLPRAASIAFAAHAFLVSGDVTPATERQVVAVAPAARAAGNRFVVLRGLTLLAQLQILQGRLHAAAATYREAAQLAPEPEVLQSMIGSAGYYFGLGDLCREWNDLAAAKQLLADGMDRAIGMTANATYFEQGFIALARLQHAHGDHTDALATLGRFADLGRQRGFDPLVLARSVAVQAQLALARGNLGAAIGWADTSGLHADDDLSFPHELEYLIFACVLIAQGRGDPTGRFLHEALSLLNRLLAAAEAGARTGSVIEILIPRALALAAQGDTTSALDALERALTLAEPQGYVRIFVDEGAPIAALLAQVTERQSPVVGYAATLLETFRRTEGRGLRTESPESIHSALSPQSSTLVESLSNRELEILSLIAEGHSNQVIADTLVVALSTVKRHINNIYGKLEVQSRTLALARARELHLL
jgi:LuxR family maltose regulon positive regulatory protein